MSKTRQTGFPDGKVWIRTYPLTFLHDHAEPKHAHAWHQLTYALRGHLEVATDEMQALIPPDRAVFVPAGVQHNEAMRAPVSVRTIYVAPGAMQKEAAARGCRTIAVSVLMRELIVYITKLAALDQREPKQAHLTGVFLDLLREAPDVPLQLPTPRDARARRLAALIEAAPGDAISIAGLAKRSGASLRTIERSFLADTGLSAAEWRRRFRLFLALRMLEGGASVTDVAFEVGYANVSAFTAAFARHFGAPPSRRAHFPAHR